MKSIVIGGGLTGLILTHRLHSAGHEVLLLEAKDVLGGVYRRPTFQFSAASRLNVDLAEWLKTIAPSPLNFQVVEHRPEIFDEGRWRSFAGFGESEHQAITELGHLSHTHELLWEPGPDQIVRTFKDQLPISAQLNSEVTEIKIHEGSASEVVVNGEKAISADHVFFTGTPIALNHLIQGEGLPAKARTRLAKMTSWTAVILELHHAQPLTELTSVLLFNHGSKEFEPVFGRVNGTISYWVTLIHSERTEEHEFTGQCIRHIKRQLKRAWPTALEGPQDEKIYVHSAAYGQNSLKTKTHWLFPEVPNLFLAHASLSTQSGFLGAIEAAKGIDDLLTGAALTNLDEISPNNA